MVGKQESAGINPAMLQGMKEPSSLESAEDILRRRIYVRKCGTGMAKRKLVP
jgi:hypothetical protein